ncbi:DHS-like NAD/FAD-binding domain-containing protein [Mycena floridula]|nr:DHS-like NAD/FAD-binding domain-containing protein [Mycena floridula]
MTLLLPLEASESSTGASVPSFLVEPNDPPAQLKKVIKSILKAKRIVVICGAGISVQAGIPDFRSSDGLFQSLKKDNPVNSGKDLFDASVFNSEQTTLLFCQMIARLSELSKAAQPTPFHIMLKALDDRSKLLRAYTQNIDALEAKSGLSFGVPHFDDKRKQYRPKVKHQPSPNDLCIPVQDMDLDNTDSSNRLPSPPTATATPRCIPLHGTLQSLHCQICTHSFALEDHIPSLSAGLLPQCPECTAMETTRQLVGKRARGIGKLRPSVVLYNEAHKDGEGVGEAARKDLVGSKGRSGADLLLVVGTSLRVPGTKRMVREFSKAVHSRGSNPKEKETTTPGSSVSSSPSPQEEEPPLKAIYLNLDFPVPSREWEGIFDVWLQGDAQKFGQMMQDELDRAAKAKELAQEKRKRREEELLEKEIDPGSSSPAKVPKKRKSQSDEPVTPKRQKVQTPLTPKSTKGKDRASSPSPYYADVPFSLSPSGPRPHLIPEVVITRAPIPSTPKKNSPFATGCAPPTPSKSPMHPGRRIPWSELPVHPLPYYSISPITMSLLAQDASEPVDLNGPRLPVSFLRTVR